MELSKRKEQAKKVRTFFLTHPELRPSYFERKCEIPATTLSHLVNSKRDSLKKIYLVRLAKTLSGYGFKP